MPKQDSNLSPLPGARGRKPTKDYGMGKIPPRPGTQPRVKTDKRGGSVDPLPGAKARMTSSDNHTPDMKPRKPITQKAWRETPDFSRANPAR